MVILMKNYEEWCKYKFEIEKENPFSSKYITEDGDVFYIEPVFYTMFKSFKDQYPQEVERILNEMERVVKLNHRVIFTGCFEHPLTNVKEDFVILELLDITDHIGLFVEDKSRGSDYGD